MQLQGRLQYKAGKALQIPITQQGGMMQLPICPSAGGRLTVPHSRVENRDDREMQGGGEGGRREILGGSGEGGRKESCRNELLNLMLVNTF